MGASGLNRYEEEPDADALDAITWWDLLVRWHLVQLDMHAEYGVDMGDRELLRARPWPWLRLRVLGLVSEPGTRLQRALRPTQTPVSMLPPDMYRQVTGIAVNQGLSGKVT